MSYRSSPAPSPYPVTLQPAPAPPQQGSANASRPPNLQITLPAGQTNTLSLKTTQLGTGPNGVGTPGLSGGPGGTSSAAGSTTLYQKAKAILHHLRTIEGFAETYLTYEPSPELGFEGEHPTAVEHVWSCLRLGSPWVRLVNLVGATGVWAPYLPGGSSARWVPLEGEDPVWEAEGQPALNWGAEQARDSRKVKACQKPLYNALKQLTAVLEAGGWPGQTELWRMTAVFGTDTNEAVKVRSARCRESGIMPLSGSADPTNRMPTDLPHRLAPARSAAAAAADAPRPAVHLRREWRLRSALTRVGLPRGPALSLPSLAAERLQFARLGLVLARRGGGGHDAGRLHDRHPRHPGCGHARWGRAHGLWRECGRWRAWRPAGNGGGGEPCQGAR
jgi:hypothetical protein